MTDETESVEMNNATGGGNMFILEPDIGLGNSLADRHRGMSPNPTRREESSVSFRRFLQSDGYGNRSTHPDLYSSARQDQSNEGAPTDPESPDLPDFVQDHIAVEQIYFNDPISPSGANLPDFASFIGITRDEDDVDHEAARRLRRYVDSTVPDGLRSSPAERPQARLRLPFDLTTDSSENNIASNVSRLPDFLSDGHVFGSDCPSQNVPSQSSRKRIHAPEDEEEERTLISMLERDNERLRGELQHLRSALLKKNDRIKELEDIVMALEISKLQMQTDANTQTVVKANENRGSTTPHRKVDDPINLDAEKLEAFSEACRNDGSCSVDKTNPNLASKVREMTSVSERLVRELLKIITDFQIDVDKRESPEGQPSIVDATTNADGSSSSTPHPK